MTGEIDNFLFLFPFSAFFAGPPDKLAEALIFICEFLTFLQSRKTFFGWGRCSEFSLFCTYSDNSMNSSATFLLYRRDKFKPEKIRVKIQKIPLSDSE
jgi:hypothetical protein